MTLVDQESTISSEDELLINLLETNITRSREEIANVVDMNPGELQDKISELLRARLVTPIVQVDPLALPIIGLEEKMICYVFIKGNIKKLDRIIQRLSSSEFPEVNLIWRLFAGRYDIIIRAYPMISRLDDFIERIEGVENIFSTNLCLCTGRYKHRGYIFPRAERGTIQALEALDNPEQYRALLNVLKEDPLKFAIEPYKETAHRLKDKYGLIVQPKDIREQLQSLFDRKVIKRIGLRRTTSYWKARGFKRRIFVWFFTHPHAQERIGTLLSKMENVNDVFDVVGKFDILAGVWTHSFHQWGSQLGHLLSIEGLHNSESFMAVDRVVDRTLVIK
ncbi:MAG: hypothetical protein ACXAEU_15735 [Candidatus Hodarchaeales archaeon]|jgi:DNA-binding Lrp family transcriptional regulator